MDPSPADRIIVALDTPTVNEARALIAQLGSSVGFYKIGLELVMAGGLDLAADLKRQGKRVFLDMKLLDIPNTVEKATANIARLGLDFLTIHGHDAKTLDAAVRGRGGSPLGLLAVTVLTSLDAADLREQGMAKETSAADLVLHRARLAKAAGFNGVIASAAEAAGIRQQLGSDFLIITPGIRPAGTAAGDQSRVMTPAKAMAAGANFLVIGRPISEASDPKAAAEAIAKEIAGGLC